MSLVSKPVDLREKVQKNIAEKARGEELSSALLQHFEEINSFDYFPVKEVEEIMIRQAQFEVSKMGKKHSYPQHLPRFSPSSSDKCERELFYKAMKSEKDPADSVTFRRRWTRNSTAVHGCVQKQLLEAEVLLNEPAFKVHRLHNDLPAWEKNIEGWKLITHNGVQFVLFGMCDGILEYQKDGSKVGFEYKTKSNSVAQIKSLREPSRSHFTQCVAYSILFGVDEWCITYESVAKDKWTTGENARPDMKIFYVKVTENDRQRLLDRWSRVAMNLQDGEVSMPDFGKCLFCPFKNICSGV